MSDREYMRRVRQIEGRLWRISQAILWREADCCDAVQEAVFRGWMKKDALRDPQFFETWMIRILINECKDMLRRHRREAENLSENLSAWVGVEERMCENLQLRQALKALPDKYRLPLLLHHMEGYPLSDVARMLDMPAKLVQSRLHLARKNLKKLLEEGENA